MVLKQLGVGPELVHRQATLTLDAFMSRTVTSVGVGGAIGVTNYSKLDEMPCNLHIPLAGRETILGTLVPLNCPPSA